MKIIYSIEELNKRQYDNMNAELAALSTRIDEADCGLVIQLETGTATTNDKTRKVTLEGISSGLADSLIKLAEETQ